MKLLLLFFMAFGSNESETVAENGSACGELIKTEKLIFVKIEEEEYVKKKVSSQYIGVSSSKTYSKWRAERWSKNEKKSVHNGCYDNEEEAAHATDTLARKLIENGEQGHRLNFPDDETEVWHNRAKSSKHIGVTYHKSSSKWRVQRYSKEESKMVSNGCYEDEIAAAHASDTLARKLMENGEQKLKLNFPDDHTEVYPEKETSKYIGVTYNKINSKWQVQRHSKYESNKVYGGCYDSEEAAGHASDTLARKLMENGEQGKKLNFPDDDTEVYRENNKKKRKRLEDLGNLQDN